MEEWVIRTKQVEFREKETRVKGGHQNWVIQKEIIVLTLIKANIQLLGARVSTKGSNAETVVNP